MPTANIYDTNVLVQVVPNLKVSQNWLLDRFFPNIIESTSEEVSIDVDIGKRRVAPFVSPMVEGKLVEQRRYQTNTFKPPYIKDKRAPDLRKPVRRMIGERIGGDMTPAEREQANLAFEMADQVDMINRRLEWMAAQALMGGTILVKGDGFPDTLIDFGRDASLTVTLAGNALWDSGNVAADPSGNIETWGTTILKSSGAVSTDIVFTPKAWKYFIKDPIVKMVLTDTARVNNAGLNPLQVGSQVALGAQYKGKWGNYDLWLYNDWYVDDTNTEVPMLTDGSVLIGSNQLSGTRAFGAIMDPEFNYGAMAYAPKSWVSKDPAQRFIMMQSSPLVIPSRVNAFLRATVTS